MSKYYILDGHTPVESDCYAWAKWLETRKGEEGWRVGHHVADGIEVSTVFLGLNHNWGDGEPLIFETMVFGGPLDSEQERYSTWEEAEAGHASMVRRAQASVAAGLAQ